MLTLRRSWATLRVFSAILSVIFFTQWASGSYLYAMMTTLERAFGLSATQIGGLKSMSSAAYSIFMVFAMISAKKLQAPRTIGVVSVGIALAFFVELIPYLYGAGRGAMGDLSGAGNGSILEGLDFRRPLCYDEETQKELRGQQCVSDDHQLVEKPGASPSTKESFNLDYLFLAAGKVITMSLAPFLVVLYSPFIDNNVENKRAATYIALIKSSQLVGPIVGMGLGSYLSQVPVDLTPVDLHPGDPQFVGAWWIGVLVFGPLLLVASIPMVLFPERPAESIRKTVKVNHDDDDQDEDQEDEASPMRDKNDDDDDIEIPVDPVSRSFPKTLASSRSFLLDFLRNVWRVLTNKIWFCSWLGDLIVGFGWGGMFTFLPKTLELQYGFAPWQASLILGLVIGGGGVLGTLLSGFVVRRLNLRPPGMALHVLITRGIYVVCFVVMLFLTSEGSNIEGEIDAQSGLKILDADCNVGCDCGQEAFSPVCGGDGKNYFSPCHAGCRSVSPSVGQSDSLVDNRRRFFNCSCVGDGDGVAVEGYCHLDTPAKGFAYSILLFFWMFIAYSNSISQFLLKFRAIGPDQKPLSVGLSMLTRSLLGNVVSSVMYGKIIDYSCLIWRENCGVRQNCYFYDMSKYHVIVHVGCAIFVFVSAFFYLGAFCFARQRNWDHLDETETKEKITETKRKETETKEKKTEKKRKETETNEKKTETKRKETETKEKKTETKRKETEEKIEN